MVEEAEKAALKEKEDTVRDRVARGETYIDNNGDEVSPDGPKKKTYMTKNQIGQIQIKNRQ
jgi:hypothetical protein